jgi:hypothetical protein
VSEFRLEVSVKVYQFKSSTGSAKVLVADRTGAGLPAPKIGKWIFDRVIELKVGALGPDPEVVEACIQRDGYFPVPYRAKKEEVTLAKGVAKRPRPARRR